jgi:lysozyme family protein
MADFERAAAFVFGNEGGLANLKGDSGGETGFGISQRWLDSMGIPVKARDVTAEQALGWAKLYWWDHYHYGDIEDQAVATKVLDLSFNAGPEAAAKCLQRALRANGFDVKDDGVLGPVTLATATRAKADCLLASFMSEEAGWYRDLDRPGFEKGWLNRAYRRVA